MAKGLDDIIKKLERARDLLRKKQDENARQIVSDLLNDPGLPEGLEQVFTNVHNRLKKDLNEPQNRQQAGISIGTAINSVASEQLERSKAKQKEQ